MEVDSESCEDIKPHVDNSIIQTEQPLLGSVTTFSNVEGSELKSQQIRSSARVFKKMKLDLSTTLVIEKPEKKEDNKQDIKKCCRPLWTSDDKSIFFEALNEYGKDFESIQMYISTKLRKKGVPDHLIKTKDQVRHLYYRSWHKISKYLKFSEGIKKVVQELYGLINYGELRKKIGAVSEKSLLKLNELIYKGSTMVRIKGKTIRVKTPMCRALRRLNQLDEKYDEIKLPTRVTVELRPKDMTSFLKVQCIAQNPRIKTTLPLQKRLSSLMACISKRWKTVDARIYDKALISSNLITNDCVPPDKVSEENKMILTPTLRLTPPNCNIEIPSINLSEYFSRYSICLNYYESRIGIVNNDYNSFYNYSNFKFMNKNNRKNHRLRTDSVSEKFEKYSQKLNSQIEDDMFDVTDNEPSTEVNKVVHNAVNTILTLQQLENRETDDESMKIKLEKKEEIQNEDQNNEKFIRINNIKKGWTENDCESLTIGEIYLMFGSDSKVILEYSWDNPTTKFEDKSCIPNNLNSNHVNDHKEDRFHEGSKNLDLSDSLSKLLSVAKLHYRKNIIKCPCGHVCGSKNNMQIKRAVESKIRKILTDIDKCTDDAEDKASEENIFENEPSFATESVYLQPNIHQLSPATYFHQSNTHITHLVSQLNSIQRLQPRYCNRRGRRPRLKQVVVERRLPLLPNKVESGHQIVRMNIISQDESQNISTSGEQIVTDNKTITKTNSSDIFSKQELPTNSFLQESQCSSNIITKTLNHSEVSLDLVNDDNTIISTVPSSPSRILKESDDQWINSEVADYSLSSLLGHLESPIKTNSTNDDSRLSQDVDAQLHSLLTQSSIDFSANFADLAAQVTKETKK